MKRFLTALSLCLLVGMPVQADALNDGIAAYEDQDYAAAKVHWEQAQADTGPAGAWAHYYLGILHEHGLGVDKDQEAARERYKRVYDQFSGFLLADAQKLQALDELPADAVHRYGMIEMEIGLEMDGSDNDQKRYRASDRIQGARVALDIAGFFQSAESFYQNAIISEQGLGRRFVTNKSLAWAQYTLAAQLGHRDAQTQADRLAADMTRAKMKEARGQYESYAKYVRPPFMKP